MILLLTFTSCLFGMVSACTQTDSCDVWQTLSSGGTEISEKLKAIQESLSNINDELLGKILVIAVNHLLSLAVSGIQLMNHSVLRSPILSMEKLSTVQTPQHLLIRVLQQPMCVTWAMLWQMVVIP